MDRLETDRSETDWARFVAQARRRPSLPFAQHWARFREIFCSRRAEDGPPPVWRPDADRIAGSNAGRLMAERGLADWAALHRWSIERREEFWSETLRRLGIVFSRAPQRVLDDSDGPLHARWLVGAELSCVDSCFAREPERTAVVFGREGSSEMRELTYGALEHRVDCFAHGLRRHGFSAGARIALYMPMTVECVVAYLAIVRAGGAVVSIADSFSASETGRRLRVACADGIVTVERLDRGGRSFSLYERVREANGPRAIVVAADPAAPPALRPGDLDWREFEVGQGRFDPFVGEPERLINVLFSSGTTGDPKAVPWTQLTPIKCAMDGTFHQDIRPGDVVAWPTNIGWMMGPWLIWAALINGAAIALFDGAPTGTDFVRFVERARVTMLGVVPSLVSAWRGLDPWDASWDDVRVFSSTGEPSNREDYLWLMSRAGYRAPVIEYCGGTEIGGAYITGSVAQPACPATFTTPSLGLDFVILDERGHPVGEGEAGEVLLVPPSIGLSGSLLNADHEALYHAGVPAGPGGASLRRHGDRMRRLFRGNFEADGRVDDTMNLGGIKVGSLELERVVNGHEAVRESAAIAVRPGGGPERLVLFVVAGADVDVAALRTDLQHRIAEELNPLFKIHDLRLAPRLPSTASNKLMRRALRAQYDDT